MLLALPGSVAAAGTDMPWQMRETAMTEGGRLTFLGKTWWPRAQALKEGESFTLDLGYNREFGGLTLRWAPGAHAARYDVELSEDGQSWQVARSVSEGNGGSDAKSPR